MTMSMTEDQRNRWIASALRSVTAASKVRSMFDQLEEGHRHKTADKDLVTQSYLEDTVRSALRYGYPIEAIAGAASMSVGQIVELAE